MTSIADIKQQAKDAATRMLEQLWEPGRFPVDPVPIANSLGIRVLFAKLPEGVSGAIHKTLDADPEIYIEAMESVPRRRFTCAHELGHFVLSQEKEVIEFVDYRDGANTPEEQFANAFAANLLMPEDDVRAEAQRLGTNLMLSLWELWKRYGVSEHAMRVRLSTLGLIPSQA